MSARHTAARLPDSGAAQRGVVGRKRFRPRALANHGARPATEHLVWRQRDFDTWSRGWVGRVTPCAPFGRSLAGYGAHGVTRPTRLRSLFATVLVGVVTLSTG